MKEFLKRSFNRADFYPPAGVLRSIRYSYDRQVMIDILERYPFIEQDVVSAHFPFWFLERKDPNFDSSFIFTILRDPIDRVISGYFSLLKDGEKINSPLEIPPNIICKMLCSDNTLQGEELLEDCKKNLERIDLIIFLDDYVKGVKLLCDILHLEYKGIAHLNKSKRTHIDEETIQKIYQLNSLDVRLYEYASTHLRNKVSK